MTTLDLKKHYSRFLTGHAGTLHFAAHSHHFWPDITREAQLNYWDDSAKLSDEKWNKIFEEVIPKTQSHIADILNLKDKNQIALAPNTHELLARILSTFLGKKELNILTTGSEFYSWNRQVLRLMELPSVNVTMIPTNDKKNLLERIQSELQKKPDLFFISQVFFDSGMALNEQDLLNLTTLCSSKTVIVIDGYHAFGALPIDLSKFEGRIFYLGGGYKYAQAGEGVGFLVVPKGEWRPAYTGWFAEYGELTKKDKTKVGYPQNAMAFMGATQDPSGFYRFNAVWDLYKDLQINVNDIHHYVQGLQRFFITNLPTTFITEQHLTPLYEKNLSWHGHFLTYESPSEEKAIITQKSLGHLKVLIDRRGKRLRFGFGIYQNMADVLALCECLKKLPPIKL